MSDVAGVPGQPTEGLSPNEDRPDVIRVFQVVSNEGQTGAWRAAAGHLSIGSHPRNEVILSDPTVSRFHCELQACPDGVWVTDLDSRNGTFVDGIRVKAAMLSHGNFLRLGHATLRFEKLAEREPIELSSSARFGSLVGSSLAMRSLFATLQRVARTEATVLLEGETGTGKGAVAEALHAESSRRDQPFVVVDCGAMTPSLIESELFGHERGAFTGADSRRAGAFEEASGGTIFLDEIGDLPADMQPKLLRVLENRAVRRLGRNTYQSVDVRVIAATNRDLRAFVNEGRFRADLYYRIAVVRIRVPPLRERTVDIPELVQALLGFLRVTPEEAARILSPPSLEALQHSCWPGNVRELRNYLEASLVLDVPPPPDELQAEGDAIRPLADARRLALEAFERRYLEELLRQHDVIAHAARVAGVTRVYLYRLLAKHRLKPNGDPHRETP